VRRRARPAGVGRELALGRAARKKGGRGNLAGEEKEWAEPESGRQRVEPFPFYFSVYFSNLLKGFLKPL